MNHFYESDMYGRNIYRLNYINYRSTIIKFMLHNCLYFSNIFMGSKKEVHSIKK